jgi:Flp pilus assembly protein CpaB
VLGGLLVATAAVGVVAALGAGSDEVATPVVVARRELSPGTPLGPDVLEVARLEVPEALRARTFSDPGALAGTVSRGALAPGELLQRGAIVAATAEQRAAAPARELAFTVPTDRAVGGRIEAGDRVDVLTTYGTGTTAWTTTVLADVAVLWSSRHDGGIGAGGSVTVAVAVPDGDAGRALAHAVDVGSVTLVRTTTAASAGDDTGERYRPPDPSSPAPSPPDPAQDDPGTPPTDDPTDGPTDAPAAGSPLVPVEVP